MEADVSNEVKLLIPEPKYEVLRNENGPDCSDPRFGPNYDIRQLQH